MCRSTLFGLYDLPTLQIHITSLPLLFFVFPSFAYMYVHMLSMIGRGSDNNSNNAIYYFQLTKPYWMYMVYGIVYRICIRAKSARYKILRLPLVNSLFHIFRCLLLLAVLWLLLVFHVYVYLYILYLIRIFNVVFLLYTKPVQSMVSARRGSNDRKQWLRRRCRRRRRFRFVSQHELYERYSYDFEWNFVISRGDIGLEK